MNIGYIIDLNGIVNEEALQIPHLSDLHYKSINPTDLSANEVRLMRDGAVLQNNYANQEIEKHLFFFVIKNDKETLKAISTCIDGIQADKVHFNQAQYEMHVVCNLIDEEGFGIGEYEQAMPCLKRNDVCVYSWLLDKYDYNGDRPIIDIRRAHAIARLAWMVVNHRGDLSLQQMHTDHSPIYNLFGDSSVFFNEKERDDAVSNYYYFKSLQHLLNIPDGKLDDYMREHVLPFRNDPKEFDRRIDVSSGTFLKEMRVPIEASAITEKTQGLLIKDSEEDNEYLVNASDNKLVFIDELSHNQRWQLEGTEEFLSGYRHRAGLAEENQETVSDEFLKDLHDKLVVHGRARFDEINNEVSKSRKDHVEQFKKNVDEHLLKFLNKQDVNNYGELMEILTPQDVSRHCSNLDYGIAFMEYLESGNGDYLIDKKVAVGDTNFKNIKDILEVEENRRLAEYEEKKREVEEKYQPQEDGQPSKIKARFAFIDREIKKYREDVRLCNYQLDHWIDEDASRKLTVRSRSLISICSGIVAAGAWLFTSWKWIRPYIKKVLQGEFEVLQKFEDITKITFAEIKEYLPIEIPSETKFFAHYSAFEWGIFTALILTGVIIGVVKLYKMVKRRKEAEKSLKDSIQKKERLMYDCVEEMKNVTERRYRHLLSYHGMKTITELMQFVAWKKEDLVNFRKTLFKLMLQYRLAVPDTKEAMPNDYNTIELNDIDVKRLLFGTEENRRVVPYCFARGGMTLSETFENFKRKKVKFETTRFDLIHPSQDEFDQAAVEREVIPCRKEDEDMGIVYTELNTTSVLPDTEGIVIEDVDQGYCGDCYFLATLASIANMNPEYIVGKNGMVEELGEEHKFFRVKFYDKEGNRVNVDVNNKFWNKNGKPIYAGVGKMEMPEGSEETMYDAWVMAVEKAWAKANNGGYDGIEGASSDGQERVRKVEYSFAVTGKSAFYCMTKNVTDRARLLEMMKKHVNGDKLPITLYSASPNDAFFANKDPYLVTNHAYALKSINEDNTFDIFNPWNSHAADEDVRGKHYERVTIDFIKDNFDVVVFFGIKEADFASFERDLTDNANEKEVTKEIEKVLKEKFDQLNLDTHNIEDLMTEDIMENAFVNSAYLFSYNRMKDERGVNKDDQHLIYLEGGKGCSAANDNMMSFLKGRGHISVQPMVCRDDEKQNLTLLRLSPHYLLSNFHDFNS